MSAECGMRNSECPDDKVPSRASRETGFNPERELLLGILAGNLHSAHEMARLGNFVMARSHLDQAGEQIKQIERLTNKSNEANKGVIEI